MHPEEFRFDNGRGETLSGRLHVPAAVPHHYALFAHCFTCGKDVVAASRISRALAQRGIGVLRFDFTGLGSSDGDFANENFSSNVEDLIVAAAALRQSQRAPSLLIGHSLGGAAVLAAAGTIPEVKAVVTIGAPSDPAHLKPLLQDRAEQTAAQEHLTVKLAGRSFAIHKHFLDDLQQQKLAEHLAKLKRALLVLHSPQDEIVSVQEAQRIYDQARQPKSFVALDGANHLLSNKQDAEYASNIIATWSTRYLVPLPAETLAGVRVETLAGKFAQRVSTGRHRLVADEPIDIGGGDMGPDPYEYLLAGLGACTSMTLSMYARRKGWPLDKVVVDLEHDRIHTDDCADCDESRSGRIDRLTRTLQLQGALDPAQRQRLVEIADKCPVHRTLTSMPHISTRLIDE